MDIFVRSYQDIPSINGFKLVVLSYLQFHGAFKDWTRHVRVRPSSGFALLKKVACFACAAANSYVLLTYLQARKFLTFPWKLYSPWKRKNIIASSNNDNKRK